MPVIAKNTEADAKNWNEFILQNGGSFLQSYEWGIFQEAAGRKIKRICGDNFFALLVQIELPFKRKYFYCPRGPVFAGSGISSFGLENFLKKIKEEEIPRAGVFLRIDPEFSSDQGGESVLAGAGFKKSFKEIQPKKTLVIDLGSPLEKILVEMHQKTRYNIRLSQKQNLEFGIFNWGSKDFQNKFDDFWELMEKTTKRDGFISHPKDYYKKILEYFPGAFLLIAKYQEKTVAANIMVFWNERATYLHGAADYDSRNLMAPHFLHWEQIKAAKDRSCAEYDFWGIDERKWPTLTRFKKSFGGKEIEYVGAWDLIFRHNFYTFYRLANIIKGIK